MIQHLHTHACLRVLIDNNSGMASYIDLIDGISLSNPDNLKLPPFVLVSKFRRTEELSVNQKLLVEVSRKIHSKSKRTVMQVMDFEIGQKGENLLIQLAVENLVVEQAGDWELEVRWKLEKGKTSKKAASVPLGVSIKNSKNK